MAASEAVADARPGFSQEKEMHHNKFIAGPVLDTP